jgi:multidrug efflux pump subunit AcrB
VIRTAIARPISTLVLTLGLALFGATNLARLPVDFLPDITYPLIKLSIAWPGATPEDIDRNLADPIERQLAAVDGLDYLPSSAIDILFQTAQQVAAKLGERAGLTNVHLSLDYSKPEWQVDIDRVRAAELGLTVSGIADTLRGYIGGHVPTRFRDGNDLFDLRVLVPERTLASRSDVEDLVLAVPDGGFVRLREVATVTRAAGPVEAIRKNQVKQVIVRADTAGVDLASAQTAARAALAEVTWPTGYAWRLGGKGQQMAEMQAVVREVLVLALFFSFLVLAVQFNSLRLPFVVFLAAPFCVAGIGYALGLGGQAFGATVIIGVMTVLATNVNDGVLLIETAQRLRAEGMERMKATREAAELRLRPRLMITLPVSLGFVPLAFAFEPGGDLLRPLAVAAIGGLLAAVLVALYLVPVLYTLIGAREQRNGVT